MTHEDKGERAHKQSRPDPPSPEEEGGEEVSSLSSDEAGPDAQDQAREEIGPEAQKMRAVYTVEQLGRLQPSITQPQNA